MTEARLPYPTGGRLASGEKEDSEGTVQIPQNQVHPALQPDQQINMDTEYPVKINGRQEMWPVSKILTKVQKDESAEEKFQKAAEMTKDAAQAISIREDLRLVMEDGDEDAFRRIGAANGTPADKVEEIITKTFGKDDEDDDEKDRDIVDDYYKESEKQGEDRSRSRQSERLLGHRDFSPDVQRVLFRVEDERVKEIVGKALDNDKVIAYNIEQHTAEGQRAIRSFVDDKIRGRLNDPGKDYAGDFGDGTRILAEVLPEIREHLQALGIPNTRGSLSLGASPGGGDTEVYPKQKPDHVSSTEGDAFEQNILETMGFHHAQAERGSS